jgi:hypothetical protein
MAVVMMQKYGMKWYSRDCTRNKIGEQGETEGIMRWLVEQGHKVVYFGAHEGTVPGVEFITPSLEGLDSDSPAAHQIECWAEDIEHLGDLGITHALQINGLAPTFSWIDNPNGARLQSFSVRMCGPWLNALQSLGLPRLCVNNDPRSYPRDQEMSHGWDWVRPTMLLDQGNFVKNTIVGGKPYRRVSVYGACESMGYLPQRENLGLVDCVVVAHNHTTCGIRSKTQDWSALEHLPPGTKVYGNGWEVGGQFMGPITPNEVLDRFREAKTCYYAPHTPGFMTGKPYVATSQGCYPCTSPLTVQSALKHYDQYIAEARATYAPDFSILQACMFEGAYGGGYERAY